MTVITRMIKFLRVGVGISNTDVEYADSTSNSIAPTSGWQTYAPAWQMVTISGLVRISTIRTETRN